MFSKILVPLDGSKVAERALPTAMKLAGKGQGDLTLLRVPRVHPVSVDATSGGTLWLYPDQAEERTLEDAAAYLEDARERWAAENIPVHTKVVSGDPASVILDTATALDVDLICMTTHGYSGLTRWMLGSVTERVLRAAPCAVMVIREDCPMRRVLIALDGSALAEQALRPGLEVARRLGAHVTLMQVATAVPVPHDVIFELELAEGGIGDLLAADTIENAKTYLAAVAKRVARYGVPVETHVDIGSAAERIIGYSAYNEIDLVVMATHGRSGLRRWAYGSVTEKVLRSGQCALLVVRSPREKLAE